jgi:Delta3-Delta2-enoyl-CoA isomerase
MQRFSALPRSFVAPSRKVTGITRTAVTVARCGKKNNIMRLSMSSPPVNSLDLTLIKDIKGALVEAQRSEDCQGIILSSACRVFCAGLDLKELYQASPESLYRFWQNFQDTLFSVYESNKPVVAEIAGVSPAGGCMLAMACDVRVASDKCQIGLNEAAFGLVAPYFGAEMMADLTGKRVAYAACSVGTVFPSAEAAGVGLLDQVVSSSGEDAAQQLQSAAEAACEAWMRAPGRLQTKQMMRRERSERWRNGQEAESREFVQRVLHQPTQVMIGAYLASLTKKK